MRVHASENAIQIFQVAMVVVNPFQVSAMPHRGWLPAMRSTPINRTASPLR